MAQPRLVSNKWEIIRVIGHGGMGSVYEVRHTTLEIRRALKTLHPHLADDPDIVKRFLREGRNEARLEHPNIVRVYDFDTDPEFGAYLTMELVEGLDLKQHMQQGALALAEVVRIGSEVAAALDYAHSAVPPIVHRDIKPANILISNKNRIAKVTDFGIAKELADRETGATGTQGFIGTIRYAAPEQVRNDVEIDARVDLYSLGVMLYEMYSGKTFLESEKPADIYRRTMVEPDWQPPMVYPSPPPGEFADVVRWCLQRQRNDRIPSARELVRCLQLCAEVHTDHVHIHPVPADKPPAITTDLAAAPMAEPMAETSVTAATIVPLVIEDESTTIVGLRARIMRLRQDLESEAENFARLFADASEIDMPRAGLSTPDTFAQDLANLDEEVETALDSRDRERLAHLFSRCEQMQEGFTGGARELRRRVADAMAAQVERLRDAWGALADAGAADMSADGKASFDALLTRAHTDVDAANWRAGHAALQQAQALLEETQAALVQRAQTTVDELLQRAAAVVVELTHYIAADATPEVDVPAARDAAAADLAAGRMTQAIERAQSTADAARHAVEQRRREAQERLAHQRRAAEEILGSLDAESAERSGSDDFRRATAALDSARNAEQLGQLIAAADYYRDAAESLTRTRTGMTEQQAARRAALQTRVAALLRDAAQAPEPVTADAQTRAQSLVRGQSRVTDVAAIAALETACQLLEATLAEVPAYRAADAAAESARAAAQRVRDLKPSPQQLATAAAAQARADAALAERRWGDAAIAYQEAGRAWAELEQQLQAERTAAQGSDEAAAALAAVLIDFDTEGAASIAAADLAAARKLEADAHDLQQQHDWTAARAAFEAARVAFGTLQERVQHELGSQLTVATTELRRRLDASSGLPALIAGSAREHAAAALAAAAAAKPSTGLSATRAALAALDNALAEAVEYQNAAAQRDAADALSARVDQLGLDRRQLATLQRLAKDAATAFDKREWTRARDTYAQLHEQLDSLERRAAQSRRLAAARNAAEEARAAVDVEVARACAPEALREAAAALARGKEAERADNLDAAATAFEAAQALFAQVADAVAREYVRLVTDAQKRLQQLMDSNASAPDEVIGEARERARKLIADPPSGDPRATRVAIEAAQAALERALDEVPLFNAARAQQQRATEAQARTEVRRPRPARKSVKAAQALLKEGAAAAQRHEWTQMRDRYEEAADAFTELGRISEGPAAPASVWPRLVPVAAVIALAIGAVVWYRAAPQPVPRKPLEPTVARPQPTPQAQINPPPAPPQPAPAPFRIASWEPTETKLSGLENKALPFSIKLAGGTDGAQAAIQWTLDKKPVAADSTTWTYKPDYDAAGTHTVAAQINRGEGSEQLHTWTVDVADVDRAPVIKQIQPDNKKPITAKIGDTLEFKVTAADDDHDPLSYHWTVDGRPVGPNADKYAIKVAAANQAVGLTVDDGKQGQDHTSWQIAAVAPLPPLVFDPVPKQLDKLRFGIAQEFKLVAPRDLSLADLTFTWTLDGRRVSDGPTFNLEPTDGLIRANPVKITATVADKQGRSFEHDWKVSVLPPAPKIESATPPTDKPIDAETGQPLAFQVAAAPTVGNQQLTYAYSVDGQKADSSGQPRFEYRVPDESEHRVSVRLKDNYGQTFPQDVTWRIQGSDVLSQARKWVAAFQEARRSCDAEKEGRLRKLSAEEIRRLKDACSKQENLQVSFTAPQIEQLASNQARAAFTMTQSFKIGGQPISGRVNCEFTLTRADGQVYPEPRPQGPCVPVQ